MNVSYSYWYSVCGQILLVDIPHNYNCLHHDNHYSDKHNVES